MEKINVAELLKDCQKGMELDCTMFNDVVFDHFSVESNTYPIFIKVKKGDFTIQLTEYGQYIDVEDAKCVIFPKGKTTWEGFMPPCKFKDGDVITVENECGVHISIYNHTTDEYGCYGCYVTLTSFGNFKINNTCSGRTCRLATEEEKQKLFQAIKNNGYKWNAEAKTLEKLIQPKFKVGDRITLKNCYKVGDKIILKNCNDEKPIYKITEVKNDCYVTDQGELPFYYEDSWKLVPNKFNITNLEPFESKVLIRDTKSQKWYPAIWGFYDSDSQDYQYKLVGVIARYCIPYEGNEHLLGKTDDCNDFYKTWR